MALRLGLIGHGRWGRKIEQTLERIPGISLVVIAKGERPATGLDGVLVATQSAAHAEVALPYIEAGIATFVEKPMATTVADAERMCAAAQQSGAAVFIGHIYLYHPAFAAALRLLPSLGAIRYVLCEGMNNQPRTDSSVLWDWLPHHLSMAGAIFARNVESVAAWSLSAESMPQAAVAKFQYGNTPLISTVSWLSPEPRMRVTVACENGTLLFDDKADRKLTLYGSNGEISNPPCSSELPLTCEMMAFVDALRARGAATEQAEQGLAVVRAIVAAHDFIALGGRSVKM